MQSAKQIQDQVWNNLFTIFNKYSRGSSHIDVSQIQLLVRQILDQDTQNQVDYVVKNLFRLDVDNSGSIDFHQFANFLLKRHCGEIALQKYHKTGKMSNSKSMKMTSTEFTYLLNQAYHFLSVNVNSTVGAQLFRNQDQNRDGFITYVQYFQFIQKYLCRDQIIPQPPKPNPYEKQIRSRLRKHIWELIRQLYDRFDYDKNKLLDTNEITKLIIEILEICSQKQINFILFNIFKLDNNGTIAFQPFATYLITHISELTLSRFSTTQNNLTRKLNVDQFIKLFRLSFSFLQFKVRDALLALIFAKIDKNNDKIISFDEYLEWIAKFLAPHKVYSRQFLVDEDDQDSGKGKQLWEQQKPKPIPPNPIGPVYPFKFSSFEFSDRVRAQCLKILIPFDANRNKLFQQEEIVTILRKLLRQDQNEIYYVVKNVFRYDKNGNRQVTIQFFTDFFLQQHLGEQTIQRIHRKNKYKRGADRVLSSQQFSDTINQALSVIQIQGTSKQLSTLFGQVDLDKDGWISYADYFLFLRYYFGSLRGSGQGKKPLEDDSKLNPLDRFVKLVRDPFLRSMHDYDNDKNMLFDQDQLIIFLRQYLKQQSHQINNVKMILFTNNVNSKNGLDYEWVRNLVLRIHIGEIILSRLHYTKKFSKWFEFKLNFDDFVFLMSVALAWMRVPPTRQLLVEVFKFIDTNRDGWITYKEYSAFIFKYLGNGVGEFNQPIFELPQPPQPKPDPKSQQQQFYLEIIGQLRIIFNNYDRNKDGHLDDENELQQLVKQVLKQTTRRQLDYVFWNLFRVDPNKDRKIQFLQFAPFILKHAAELALQRFHTYQKAGKSTLTETQFISVVKNSYGFLKSMPTKQGVIKKIFANVDNDRDSQVTYKQYMGWAHFTVAPHVR